MTFFFFFFFFFKFTAASGAGTAAGASNSRPVGRGEGFEVSDWGLGTSCSGGPEGGLADSPADSAPAVSVLGTTGSAEATVRSAGVGCPNDWLVVAPSESSTAD